MATDENKNPPVFHSDWTSIVLTEPDSEVKSYRCRKAIPAGFVKATAPTRVHVYWEYEAGTDGRPSDSVLQRMYDLDAIIGDSSGDYVRMLVIDGSGIRKSNEPGLKQWIFYVQDAARFKRELLVRLSGESAFPIKFAESQDADWSLWEYRAKEFEALTKKAVKLPDVNLSWDEIRDRNRK